MWGIAGSFELKPRRDRDGTFEPQIIKKRQTTVQKNVNIEKIISILADKEDKILLEEELKKKLEKNKRNNNSNYIFYSVYFCAHGRASTCK